MAGARLWAEALIARREAARRFLEARGMTPSLLNRDQRLPPNHWQVPGWRGPLLDHDLIEIAEGLGMERADG